MPETNRAALDGNREAAQEDQRTRIFTLPAKLRNCYGCGAQMPSRPGASHCPTCAAWRRWYAAHRAASQAPREATHR